jgi:DNA-binding phage protein
MAAVITMITGGMLPDDDTAITHAKKVIIQLGGMTRIARAMQFHFERNQSSPSIRRRSK